MAVLLCFLCAADVFGAIKESDVFLDAEWSYAGETSVFQETGWLQSLCTTEDYIICFENYSNTEKNPDTLIAFYKNPYDENGNPVQQYSYAKHVTERDYEHGNGMTYNPIEQEIVIAGGHALDRKNRGCLFIADSNTLKYKRTVKISENGRVAAVDYWKDKEQFILLIGSPEDTFEFVITDREFRVLDTIPDVDSSLGNTFQDFCISGDYIISIPFMKRIGKDDVLQVYSISEKRLVGTYGLQMENAETFVEPESICEIEPGRLLIGSGQKDPNRIVFYTTKVDAAFSVTTEVNHGIARSSQKVVDQGTDFSVRYTADEGYELSSLNVDGEELSPADYPNEYVFHDLQENHRITINFEKIPEFTVKTKAHNGTIDGAARVQKGKSVRIGYAPEKHYELSRVLIDGEELQKKEAKPEYTFDNVTEDHTIEVFFTEVPVYTITAKATNGRITPKEARVYRGGSSLVEYSGKRDYEPAHIRVDGVEQEDVTLEELRAYRFRNVREDHTIEVVYQWKYLPFLILGSFWMIAWLIAMQALKLERRRRSRRWKKIREMQQNEKK